MKKTSKYILLILAFILFGTAALADDVGITKARLIQKSERSYLIEADVNRALVWAIKAPIFPDRFQVSEVEFINQAGWIVVQATATTEGGPLSARDRILLPWMRNGASLTAQWLDGTIRQGLFLRSLEGIHVPVKLLMDVKRSLPEVCREHFKVGVQHVSFHGIHLMFAAAVCLVFPAAKAFTALGYYIFGQALSLVLSDLGVPGFELLFVDVLGIVLVILILLSGFRNKSTRSFLIMAAVYGLLHGLAYAQGLQSLELSPEQQAPALFMFNLGVDFGHFATAGLLFLLFKVARDNERLKKLAIYTVGSLAVTVLLIVFQDNVVAGKTNILPFEETQIATRFALPAGGKTQTGGQRPRGARKLTSPIMTYLSVEPYEVRQEVLIRARAAVQFLGVDERGMGSIPVTSQEAVKQGILEVFQKTNPISIDGNLAAPVLTRTDFVTLGPAGVVLRQEPIVESLDQGIIGLTLVYETPALADEVAVDWQLFSKTVQRVEATSTDPFGGATVILSPDANRWQWKSRLSGYQVPVIEEIAVQQKNQPIVSIALFSIALILILVAFIKKQSHLPRSLVLGVLGLGFVLYPFATYPLDLPWVSRWAPSHQRTAIILNGLLTNVYRAFDVRDESRVYDRLAVSVTGEQLSKIYLENRKALEFENRGGARANVDEVKVLAVDDVRQEKDKGYSANARWTVSGSVSHFGHTHYRRNQYHARVRFINENGYWKIQNIELIDEKRVF